MKEAGSAVNLVSASTDDAEKVFQEAIEQVTESTHLLSLTEHMTQLLLIKGCYRLFIAQRVTVDILISVVNTLFLSYLQLPVRSVAHIVRLSFPGHDR